MSKQIQWLVNGANGEKLSKQNGAKALDLRELWPQCLALFGFFAGFTGLSLIMLKKQEV